MSSLGSANPVTAHEQVGLQALDGTRLKADRLKQALAFLILPLTFSLAITHQSLWMDEGYTAWFAAHSSLSSFFSGLMGGASGTKGDPQMVLYLVYMWSWVKGFGQ